MSTAPTYIYDPTVVEAALDERPYLRTAVGARLTARSPVAFPEARCSPLQIARVLGATRDYPRTLLVADNAERGLAAGLKLRWLTTSSRSQFRSGLAEVRIACEFIRREFAVEDLDEGKNQDRVPELVARDGEFAVAVEVYAPRDWQHLTDLTDELGDCLRHIDSPTNYDIELTVGPLSRFDEGGELASLHPGPVDAGLDDEARDAAVASVLERITAALCSSCSTAEAAHVVARLNLKIEAVLTRIRPAPGPLPQRNQSISGWPAGGYAPERMFDRLARRRVRHKLRRRQAADAGLGSSLLIVDLAQVALAGEWDHDFYRHAFEAALERHVVPDLIGHDAVAFCDASNPDSRPRLRCAVVSDAAPDRLRRLLVRLAEST